MHIQFIKYKVGGLFKNGLLVKINNHKILVGCRLRLAPKAISSGVKVAVLFKLSLSLSRWSNVKGEEEQGKMQFSGLKF